MMESEKNSQIESKTKNSCSILYEYGATVSIVNTIVQSGYSLEEIKENPNLLQKLFSDYRAVKILKIIKLVDDVNRKSIFDLCNYGLSKGIADELFNLCMSAQNKQMQ